MKTAVARLAGLVHRHYAARVAAVYALFGAIWILFSDHFLTLMVHDRMLFERVSIAKGWIYVAITAVLLYLVLRRDYNQIESALLDVEQKVRGEQEEQRQALEDGRLALLNLVEDLQEKTEQLEELNQQLQKVDNLKSMFIASMSHELRTPLNSVIGFTSILLHGWVGPVNQEQRTNLETVLKSGKHLLALVNDVIDVSKIEAGQLETFISEFSLLELFKEAEQLISAEYGQQGLWLKMETGEFTLRTDRRRLLQCLLNLLSNGLKYTLKGGVTCNVRQKTDGLLIEITDTGIGIDSDDCSRLFKPFVRLDSPLRLSRPGTGLGLYLSRKLMRDVIGGDILISSEPGIGTVFSLQIPGSVLVK
jgi:signal transduction histidine kinase